MQSAALAAASIPTLVMCLAQITGDDRWLAPRYRPQRDPRLFHEPSGGLSEAAQAEVREAMANALQELASGRARLPPPPSEEQLATMASACVGESVPREYVPLLLEELGFRDRDVHWSSGAPPAARRFRVLVIGGGISGIAAAAKLDALGVDWTLVEKSAEVGGVWLDNDYPDAGVDTPSHFYSYSFAPNPAWTHNFSKRAEVLAYLRDVAAGHRQRMVFQSEVRSLVWDEPTHEWIATIVGAQGAVRELRAHAVISAVGQLNRPKWPAAAGLDRFAGPLFHSARWRHDVALAGQRVSVVGAGASAMQLMRTVARASGHVTLLQRSPQWVMPIPDYHGAVSADTRWLLANVPFYRQWYRFGLFWRFSDGVLRTLRREPEWPHPQRAVSRANDRTRQWMAEYLQTKLAERPDLIAKLLPDYPPYGKRMLLDNEWFETLARPNVSVVTAGLQAVEPHAVIDTAGARHPTDVLILATGFEAGKLLESVHIVGRAGRVLAERWANDNPKAYLGITVPGFPNFFCMYGPNTNLGHGGSAIFQIECQARYISACLVRMLEERIGALDVTEAAHDAYNERVDREHAQLVWTHPGTNNWFRNAAGRVFSIMPWRMVDYWAMTHDPDFTAYHLTRS